MTATVLASLLIVAGAYAATPRSGSRREADANGAAKRHQAAGGHQGAGGHHAAKSHHRAGQHHAGRSRGGAKPKPNAAYTGKGADYLNNAPGWLKQGAGRISFETSRNGRRILDFKGTLSFACDTHVSFVTARYLKVDAKGGFAYRFNYPSRTPGGKVYGRRYVAIYGHFFKRGQRAIVSYFVDAVVAEKPVAHPYDTAHPHALGCSSWVRGVAKAR